MEDMQKYVLNPITEDDEDSDDPDCEKWMPSVPTYLMTFLDSLEPEEVIADDQKEVDQGEEADQGASSSKDHEDAGAGGADREEDQHTSSTDEWQQIPAKPKYLDVMTEIVVAQKDYAIKMDKLLELAKAAGMD